MSLKQLKILGNLISETSVVVQIGA